MPLATIVTDNDDKDSCSDSFVKQKTVASHAIILEDFSL
jgi:hypothetical protein